MKQRLLHIAFLMLLSVAALGQGAASEAIGGKHVPAVTGSLAEVDGVRVLCLWGTPRERGFAEGYLLADSIMELVNGFAISEELLRMPKIWDMMVRPTIQRRLDVTESLRERAQGLLAGLTARRGDELKITALSRSLDELDILATAALPDFVGLLCSSFSAWGPETAAGKMLVGRNLDYTSTDAFAKNVIVKVHAALPGRAAWISIGWPGIDGCLTGVSQAGVFLSIHDVMVKTPASATKFTPRALALQELIESLVPKKDIVTTALALLRRANLGYGGNAMLAWTGDHTGAAVLEFDGKNTKDEGVTARMPAKGDAFVTCSNHHRQRTEPRKCWRYQALFDALKIPETCLDFDMGWELIGRSSVNRTVYRTMVDLESGRLELDRRKDAAGEGWLPRSHLNTKKLFALLPKQTSAPEAPPR